MKTFFQDEFMNLKVLNRLAREIRKDQLDCAIEELASLNEAQSKIISRSDFMTKENNQLSFINKINNAARRNNI